METIFTLNDLQSEKQGCFPVILLSLPKLAFCACILAFGKWLSPGGKGKRGGVLPSLGGGKLRRKERSNTVMLVV